MLCEKMTFWTQSARLYSLSEADESMIAEIQLRVIDHCEQQPFLSPTNNPCAPSWLLSSNSSYLLWLRRRAIPLHLTPTNKGANASF
jgi:hypothetical protein